MVSTHTPVCDFGAPAPGFSLQGVDDKQWTLQDCVGPRGLLVSFGGASGPVPLVDLNEPRFMARAPFIVRASLFNYAASPEDRKLSSRRVFSMIRSKKIKLKINQRYPLKDAAKLHKDVESRKTTGISMLVP